MSLRTNVLRDLYGDDLDYEYHQDYREGELLWRKYLTFGLPSLLLSAVLIYTTLYSLDYNLLPLSEAIWNWFVYLTPAKLLDLLDKDWHASTAAVESQSSARTHAAKSEAMRRIVGLDKPGGIMGTVAQASRRRLSSLSGISMMVQGQEERPPGLGNWDNSCYQNSVLQGLASLDSFSNYLEGPVIEEDAAAENQEMKMADSLRELITKLKDPSNNGKRIWTPAALKSMSSWQQQDAQEYFSKVLDEIDKEVESAASRIKKLQGLTVVDRKEPEVMKVTVPDTDMTTVSTIKNPLEGLLAQRVGCTRCGYSEGLSLIPFNCLTVPLGKSWKYEIGQCLDEYTKLEPIEGVQCGKCTLLRTQRLLTMLVENNPDVESVGYKSAIERLRTVEEALEDDDYEDKTLTNKCKIPPKNRMTTTKSRQAVVARPPQSLVVHINRSMFDETTGELKKNYAEVKFQNRLDLGPWCLGSNGKTSDTTVEEWLLDPAESMIASRSSPSRIHGPVYELRAVVTHYGRHENGHYIAYRKHPLPASSDDQSYMGKESRKEQWWRLSDDDVSQVSEDNVLNQGGVFMLFYDLVEPPTLAVKKPSPSKRLEDTPHAEASEFKEFLESRHPEFLVSRKPEAADGDAAAMQHTLDETEAEREDDSSVMSTQNDESETSGSRRSSVTEASAEAYSPAKPIRISSFVPAAGAAGQDQEVERTGVQGVAASTIMV